MFFNCSIYYSLSFIFYFFTTERLVQFTIEDRTREFFNCLQQRSSIFPKIKDVLLKTAETTSSGSLFA